MYQLSQTPLVMLYVCAPHKVRSLTSDYECTLPKLLPHPCFVFSCVCDPLVGTCLLDSTCGGSIGKLLPECSICLYCGHQAPCWYSHYNSLFGMLCRWHKVFSNLCVCSCCADLRCCSGSMRYVNKLSYQGVPPITKKAVFQVGRLVVRQMH